ncbi:MAG: Gx transporter family protein [Huintestinicola sp.]
MKCSVIRTSPSKYAAFMGMSFALTAALSAAESMFLSPVIPLPGVRLGLANCVIITAAALFGSGSGILLCILRGAFVLITRGVTAGIMSLCGGICSFITAVLLMNRLKCSVIFSSVTASAVHVIAQMICSAVMLGSTKVLYYSIFLIPAAILTGICTGGIIKQVLPLISKYFKGGKHREKAERDSSESS